MTYLHLGYWASLLTTLLTVFTFGVAIFTLPLSGPMCAANCYSYPYTDVASRFPRDYYFMFPAMILHFVVLVLMAAVHYYSSDDKKIFSHIGLLLTFLSSSLLITNYFLQISVIQPSLLNGETDGISLLTQFNPHGIFIALDELAFVVLSLAFLFMAPVFAGNKVATAVRGIFIASFVLNVIALAGFSSVYGVQREYLFEIATISIGWLTLIVSGILLAILFKRQLSTTSQH